MVTTAFPIPIRSTFCDKIFALAGWISLLTKSPSPIILPAAWVVFPPGAAHRSRIRSPGRASKASPADMALGS